MFEQSALERREIFLKIIPCLSLEAIETIAASGQFSRDELLGVHYLGRLHFPAFQFDNDGGLLPGVQLVMSGLRPQLTPWEIAFWLIDANPRRNNHRPVDWLDNIEWIESAVRDEVAPVSKS